MKTKHLKDIIRILLILQSAPSLRADFASYASNPFVFSHAGGSGDPVSAWRGGNILLADLTLDGNPDFIVRSLLFIYAYDHQGTLLWQFPIWQTGNYYNKGATYGVCHDLNGDRIPDMAAVNGEMQNQILLISGGTGTSIGDPLTVPLNTGQRVGHLAVVNLRGSGDRDLVVQTVDVVDEEDTGGTGHREYYYINRSLRAFNLETRELLWTVNQDRIFLSGGLADSTKIYEGYWGQTHGPLLCADVDGDGFDEVVGGTLIDPVSMTDPGVPVQIVPRNWLGYHPVSKYFDHLDVVLVGDLRPDLEGLEWLVAYEDDVNYSSMYTGMYSKYKKPIWRKRAAVLLGLLPDFPTVEKSIYVGDKYIEPQMLTAGNFNPSDSRIEIWNGSRQGDLRVSTTQSQHPWLYDEIGSLFAHYATGTVLPAGFNLVSNLEGIEMTCTIDWEGGAKDFIAARARYRSDFTPVDRHIGIFDALDGSAVWTTIGSSQYPSQLFIADVQGDSREELIIYDNLDHTFKVYWNSSANPSPGANKWLDPLYRRVKQTWNYYSTGSYARPSSVPLLQVAAMLQGPYNASGHVMNSSLQAAGHLPNLSPYDEDPRTASASPENTVDWILVQVCAEADTEVVFSRSAFLLSDGSIVEDENVNGINLYSMVSGDYYLVLRHRNHLAVISASTIPVSAGSTVPYDFSTGGGQAGGTAAMKQLETGVWGLWAGDADGSGQVGASDRNETWNKRTQSGYLNADCDLSGSVGASDRNITWNNRTKMSQLP